MYNGTFNTLCTLTRLDVGSLQRGGGTETLLKPAMREMLTLIRAVGHELDESFLENLIAGSPPTTIFKPSMLVDAEKGNPLELEVILGAPLRYAKELKVDVPVLQMVYDLLKVVQWGLLETRKQK